MRITKKTKERIMAAVALFISLALYIAVGYACYNTGSEKGYDKGFKAGVRTGVRAMASTMKVEDIYGVKKHVGETFKFPIIIDDTPPDPPPTKILKPKGTELNDTDYSRLRMEIEEQKIKKLWGQPPKI